MIKSPIRDNLLERESNNFTNLYSNKKVKIYCEKRAGKIE